MAHPIFYPTHFFRRFTAAPFSPLTCPSPPTPHPPSLQAVAEGAAIEAAARLDAKHDVVGAVLRADEEWGASSTALGAWERGVELLQDADAAVCGGHGWERGVKVAQCVDRAATCGVAGRVAAVAWDLTLWSLGYGRELADRCQTRRQEIRLTELAQGAEGGRVATYAAVTEFGNAHTHKADGELRDQRLGGASGTIEHDEHEHELQGERGEHKHMHPQHEDAPASFVPSASAAATAAASSKGAARKRHHAHDAKAPAIHDHHSTPETRVD
jgi:hypothetical protein